MASVRKRRWTHKGVTKEAWEVRYFDEKGSRRSKAFELKKDADTFKRQAERELEDGIHTPETQTMKVAAVGEHFLVHVDQRHRNGQIGRTRREQLHHMVDKVLVPELGNVAVSKLTATQIERLFVKLTAPGGVAPVTARGTIQAVKQLQDFAIKRQWMKTRPVDEALVDLAGIKKRRIRVPTPDEIARLMQVAAIRLFNGTERTRARTECMLHIAVFAGLRQGEVLGLGLDHIDLERRIIRVRQNRLWDGTLKGPKTAAGVRDVPISTDLADKLHRWIERFYKPNPNRLIFLGQWGKIIDASTLHLQWQDLKRRAGIDETDETIRWHALRHFCASWMIRHGLPTPEVAKLLGHRHFDTTLQIYTHAMLSQASQHEAIERMGMAMPAPGDATVTQLAVTLCN